MYTNRLNIESYPYKGLFYRMGRDESKPLDQQVEEKIVFFETVCDITESSHSQSGNFLWSKYAVYFPFDSCTEKVEVKVGDLFEANMCGITVNGKVVGVFPSQLNGVTIYVQDTDV